MIQTNKPTEVLSLFEKIVQSIRGGNSMKNKCGGGKKGGGKPGKGGK